MTARCRSCGAPIVWATTTRGRLMPVDVDPTPDGTLLLTGPPAALRVDAAAEPTLFDGETDPPRYTSHYATCPHANRWRKPQ